MPKIRASRSKVLQATSIVAGVGLAAGYGFFGLLPYTLPVFVVAIVLLHTALIPAFVEFTDDESDKAVTPEDE